MEETLTLFQDDPTNIYQVIVTNDTYINAQSICDLLYKLAGLGLTIPITLVLDNARYQKCGLVFELAQSLNIELLYLTT